LVGLNPSFITPDGEIGLGWIGRVSNYPLDRAVGAIPLFQVVDTTIVGHCRTNPPFPCNRCVPIPGSIPSLYFRLGSIGRWIWVQLPLIMSRVETLLIIPISPDSYYCNPTDY